MQTDQKVEYLDPNGGLDTVKKIIHQIMHKHVVHHLETLTQNNLREYIREIVKEEIGKTGLGDAR